MTTTTTNGPDTASGRAQAMKGMSMLRSIEIPAGEVIYRFYDSHRAPTPSRGALGIWWLEFNDFQTIKHFALRHDHSLSYAARLFAAILYEWSEVDAFVACRTLRPMPAFKGRGKQVQSEGRDARDLPKMTPMQRILEVYQLCIPTLGKARSLSDAGLDIRAHGAL